MPLEIAPFFEIETRTDLPKPDTPEEALNEAQQFAFSRIITREIVKRTRTAQEVNDLVKLSIEATDHQCVESSFRMAYHLWRHASHLFKDIFILQAYRHQRQPTVFHVSPESTIDTGMVTQDINGKWYFFSPANDDGTPSTLLKSKIIADSLEELIQKVEKREVNVSNSGETRLFPTAQEIQAQLKEGKLLHKPELDPIDFTQESELKNPDQFWTQNFKYIPLDSTELNFLEETSNREKCEVIRMPIIYRRTQENRIWRQPWNSINIQKMVVPKE